MARAGTREKVGPGRYRLATSDVTESHSLVLACSMVPSSVICLSTALLFHNLGTQLPRGVWLAKYAAFTDASNIERATFAPDTP